MCVLVRSTIRNDWIYYIDGTHLNRMGGGKHLTEWEVQKTTAIDRWGGTIDGKIQKTQPSV